MSQDTAKEGDEAVGGAGRTQQHARPTASSSALPLPQPCRVLMQGHPPLAPAPCAAVGAALTARFNGLMVGWPTCFLSVPPIPPSGQVCCALRHCSIFPSHFLMFQLT